MSTRGLYIARTITIIACVLQVASLAAYAAYGRPIMATIAAVGAVCNAVTATCLGAVIRIRKGMRRDTARGT